MGTTIYESKNGHIQLKRFYGRKEKGVCYQLNVGVEYVQLTEAELKSIIIAFIGHLFLERITK